MKFLKAILTEGMRYEDRKTLLHRLRALAQRELELKYSSLPS